MRDKVEQVIQVIRPAIQADQGDIFLVDVDEGTGVVTVELTGACVSCPASTVTLKAGVERILKDRVPGVTAVVDATDNELPGAGADPAKVSPFAGDEPAPPAAPGPAIPETAVSL